MKKYLFILALLFALPATAQVSNPAIIPVTTAPSGSCAQGLPNQQVLSTGVQYSCQNGMWAAIGGGGSSGFPITLGSTSIAASSTTTAVNGLATLNGLSFGIYNTSVYNVGGGMTGITGSPSASTATGVGSLGSDRTPANETAYGSYALGGVTASGDDAAFGTNACGLLQTGQSNTCIGEGAAYNLGQTSSASYAEFVTALGYEAGLNAGLGGDYSDDTIFIGAGSGADCVTGCGIGNTQNVNNIFIGDNTEPYTYGDRNEIVIGAGTIPSLAAHGNGSHTATIGDATQTKFYPVGTIYLPGAPTAPTVASNAGTGSLTHGTDNAGIIATGAASTASTLTFGVGWATWASCMVSASTATAQPYVSAISASAVTFTYVTTGTPTLYYSCFGQ